MESHEYLILGGGVVAGYAAQAFAKGGIRPGALAILSAEKTLPYDRPPLSKEFLAGKKNEADILIEDAAFYRQHGIDVHLNTRIESVDFQLRCLKAASGEVFGFGSLLIATGSRVQTLDVPGADLSGIFYLRTVTDSEAIRRAAKEARQAVVVGSGFIAMEAAATLAGAGVPVTVVFRGAHFLGAVFTPPMSDFFHDYYRSHGVTLRPGQTVTGFRGEGHVAAVTLAGGEEVPADLVVAGVGVAPNVSLFEGSGLEIDGGIVVDERLRTQLPNVYAAGDVVQYRDVLFDKPRHIEHWDNAKAQGRHAAGNMLGKDEPFVHVPYFFSDVFDLSWEYWGDADGADRVVYRGDMHGGAFSTWWLRGERVVAAFAMNRPAEETKTAPEWIKHKQTVSAAALANDTLPLASAAQTQEPMTGRG